MIKRITRIDNYRVFQRWRSSPATGDFARINVIYGINGSGKSTLASLLAEAVSDSSWVSGLNLSVTDAAGASSTVSSATDPFWRNVYVFNEAYVHDNLRFDVDGESVTEPLLILGKEQIDQSTRLHEIESRLKNIPTERSELSMKKRSAERESSGLATKTATLIVQELEAVGGRYAARSYDARKVKQILRGSASDLSAINVSADLDLARSPAMPTLASPDRLVFDTGELLQQVRDLVARTALSEPLDRLRDDAALASWVQRGLELHQAGDDCSFCGNSLSLKRVERLGRHFDESLRLLQKDCETLAKRAVTMARSVSEAVEALPNKDALDPTLRERWEAERKGVDAGLTSLLERLEALRVQAVDKQRNPFTNRELSDLSGTAVLDLSGLGKLIVEHNELVGQVAQRRTAAAKRVETARVEAIRTPWEASLEQIDECSADLGDLAEEERDLQAELRRLSQKELDASPLADSLNHDLARLLGRDELSFRLGDNGYMIEREGVAATYLSEGEKTAISLLYFLKSLDAYDCDRANAIVVVDDPISSLDSNVVAGISAHLWSRLVGAEKCKQLFLLTHSFDLFRSWTNQLDRLQEHVRTAQGITFSMQELRIRSRSAVGQKATREPFFMLWPNDKAMRGRLRSEYHYLFWRAAETLVKCQQDPTPDAELDAAAILPNVCRRLLEGFLSFKYPGKIGDFRALVELAIGSMDESVTRTRIVSYLHQYSHNEEGDISKPVSRPESIRMLGAVFDVIRYVDSDHYDRMCTALSVQPELLEV